MKEETSILVELLMLIARVNGVTDTDLEELLDKHEKKEKEDAKA